MTRPAVLLLILLVLSSLALVRSVHEMRQLVASSHRADLQLQRLAGDQRRLEAERQAEGTTRQVERTARERLAMRSVTPAVTYYEGQGAAQFAASAPGAPRAASLSASAAAR